MNEPESYLKEKDIFGQEIPQAFVKAEEVTEKPGEIDYSKVWVLPTIKARYISMLIDILILIVIYTGVTSLLEIIGQVPGLVKAILFVVVVLLYEPILITSGATIGQLFMGLRVRDFKNPDHKLTFHLAVLRTVVKILLGWVSFVTVTFNVNRRAIHDFASGSIMTSQRIKP
jgi:uncharacterized RDD family membrane protein YckC